MEHVFALPDCNLKSGIAQEILIHLNIFEVIPWRAISRFWRSECAHYVRKIDVEVISLKNDGQMSFLDGKPQSWYESVEKDLCAFFFICSNLNKGSQSTIQIQELFFAGKISILDLFLRSNYDFFLTWFESKCLILTTASSVDWTKMNSVERLQINQGAENVIDRNFYENVRVSKIVCLLTSTEKLFWPGIATIIKDWQANRREITEIDFFFDDNHRGVDFDVFLEIQPLIRLMGGNIKIKMRNRSLISWTAWIYFTNKTETKCLWIGLNKRNNMDIQLLLRGQKIETLE